MTRLTKSAKRAIARRCRILQLLYPYITKKDVAERLGIRYHTLLGCFERRINAEK